MTPNKQVYLIGFGSNVRTKNNGPPEMVLRASFEALQGAGLSFRAISPISYTKPLGPSLRMFANGAAVIETDLGPEALLKVLKQTEKSFGRKQMGVRWRARVLDLDILLWNGGIWVSKNLNIPHKELRYRRFVLQPAKAIAQGWRDPITNLSIRHLHARLTKPRSIPRARAS